MSDATRRLMEQVLPPDMVHAIAVGERQQAMARGPARSAARSAARPSASPDAPAGFREGAWSPLKPVPVERWKGPLKAAFDLFAPQAVYIASPERPVSVALLEPRQDDKGGWHVRIAGWRGGNPFVWQQAAAEYDREGHVGPKGCLPVAFGLTGRQEDRVTARLPRDPYVPWAVRRRVWTVGLDDSDDALGLKEAMEVLLRQARVPVDAAPLPWGYIDAGWRFDAAWFEAECILPAAARLGLWARSEVGLEQFLRRAMGRAQQEHGGAARAHFHDVCLAMVREEMEARKAWPALGEPFPLTVLGAAVERAVPLPAGRGHPARGYAPKAPAYRTPEIMRQIEGKLREGSVGRGGFAKL
jgi:hypothetical protein